MSTKAALNYFDSDIKITVEKEYDVNGDIFNVYFYENGSLHTASMHLNYEQVRDMIRKLNSAINADCVKPEPDCIDVEYTEEPSSNAYDRLL
jgi:hypothetical protein